MDVHGKVSEVARELALQVGRGQFLNAAFCLSERYGIGGTGCVLLFPFPIRLRGVYSSEYILQLATTPSGVSRS